MVAGPSAGFGEFAVSVDAAFVKISHFIHRVVVCRKDSAVRGWRSWVLEDPLVHPYRWLRPDSPFFKCSREATVDGSGILVELAAIDD